MFQRGSGHSAFKEYRASGGQLWEEVKICIQSHAVSVVPTKPLPDQTSELHGRWDIKILMARDQCSPPVS